MTITILGDDEKKQLYEAYPEDILEVMNADMANLIDPVNCGAIRGTQPDDPYCLKIYYDLLAEEEAKKVNENS